MKRVSVVGYVFTFGGVVRVVDKCCNVSAWVHEYAKWNKLRGRVVEVGVFVFIFILNYFFWVPKHHCPFDSVWLSLKHDNNP